MKRLILTIALVLGLSVAALAQNYAVVNSEKIFKSIEAYNAAITQLDELADGYQKQVDEKFAESNHEVANILSNAKIPTVLIDSDITRPPQRSDYDLITVGNIGAGRKIAEHLHARGYKRIAFLMGENPLMANSNWSDRLFGLAGELALLGQREGVRQLGFPPEDESRLQKLKKVHTYAGAAARKKAPVPVGKNENFAAEAIRRALNCDLAIYAVVSREKLQKLLNKSE